MSKFPSYNSFAPLIKSYVMSHFLYRRPAAPIYLEYNARGCGALTVKMNIALSSIDAYQRKSLNSNAAWANSTTRSIPSITST